MNVPIINKWSLHYCNNIIKANFRNYKDFADSTIGSAVSEGSVVLAAESLRSLENVRNVGRFDMLESSISPDIGIPVPMCRLCSLSSMAELDTI